MSTEKLEKTNCVMFIGRDPPVSHQTIWEATIKAKKQRGIKIICIDPEKSKTAKAADLWLPLRPGTDAALLLSMINVIIDEELYDKEFVAKWCHGFEQLRKRAQQFPAEQISEITWVPKEKIKEAARLFAVHKPSCAFEGMGVSQQPHAINALMARYIISAITGNIDVPGGEELLGPAPFITEHEIELPDMLPVEQRTKMLGSDQYRLSSWQGYELIQKNVERVWGKRCDQYANTCQAPAPLIYRAIASGKPYPIRGFITLSSNPMVTQANTKLVYRALKSLDLYVVVDMIMTPSAQLADYVLPAASWLERDFLFNFHNTTPVMLASRAALPPIYKDEYDRRSDFDFWKGLGTRLGQAKYWSWETVEEYYDYRLKPLGLSFKELAKKGKWTPERQEFRKFENTGFGTPTGKVELYSTALEDLGYDPLPGFIEPDESPVSRPDTAKDFPYILITGGRFLPYFHSEFRQVESFRKIYPHPKVTINPKTARENLIEEGDWVWIETPRGRVIQKCVYSDDIDYRVIHAQHGWWYPEWPGEEPWLHGAWISNINVVTDDEPAHCDRTMGSWPLRTMLCKVYKANEFKYLLS
jgi:anaerobic selenocysteine-containing dehydrogenase